jgi:hypothetical protein
MRTYVATLVLSAVLLFPCAAAAQQAAATAEEVEDFAQRYGLGVRGGVGLDPEIIDFGAHATFGPIFKRNIVVRPGIEFGVGEVTTMFAINVDALYTLPGATAQTRWIPYVGAGPNFGLSHRGFETEDPDHVDTNTNGNAGRPNRFDFSDTDFTGGFNFIVGARSRRGTFFEMNATAYGVTNIRLLAGFNF